MQDKIKKIFEFGSAHFSEKKLDAVLNSSDTAFKKAQSYLGDFLDEFFLLWNLLNDYKSKKYRKAPWRFIAAIGFFIIYLLNPFDLIPDFIPVWGYTDDISVFSLVLTGFKSDIEEYRKWKIQEKNER